MTENVAILKLRVRPLNEKERRGHDPMVVSFPGNGQILVSFIEPCEVNQTFTSTIHFGFSAKEFPEVQAVVRNQNYSVITLSSNQVLRKAMLSSIQESNVSSKWLLKVSAARHFVTVKLDPERRTH